MEADRTLRYKTQEMNFSQCYNIDVNDALDIIIHLGAQNPKVK